MTEKNKPPSVNADWSQYQGPIRLTPEQTIQWLEGMREFMFEIWKNNPEWRPVREESHHTPIASK